MLADLAKTKASRVVGIDASTNSIAFCLYYNRRPTRWGKINLTGANIYERILDAKCKCAALATVLNADYIVVEGAVNVRSVAVAIKLAYVFGVILAEFQAAGAEVITVVPMTWQSYIGNKVLTPSEKAKLRKAHPGKSPSWYQKAGRDLRKQRTMDFFNKRFNMNLEDDDVGDATGLAFYGYQTQTKRK